MKNQDELNKTSFRNSENKGNHLVRHKTENADKDELISNALLWTMATSLPSFRLTVVCKNTTNYSFPPSTHTDLGLNLLTCFGQLSITYMTQQLLESLRQSLVQGQWADVSRNGANPRQAAARGTSTPANAHRRGRRDACYSNTHVSCEWGWEGSLPNATAEMLVGKQKLVRKQLPGP